MQALTQFGDGAADEAVEGVNPGPLNHPAVSPGPSNPKNHRWEECPPELVTVLATKLWKGSTLDLGPHPKNHRTTPQEPHRWEGTLT